MAIDLRAFVRNTLGKKMILGVRVGVSLARGVCLEYDHPVMWGRVMATRCTTVTGDLGGGSKTVKN